MSDTDELAKQLSEPFPAEDVEWRVSRAGVSSGKVWCRVLAYITARAIQQRLDDVVGCADWKLEEPRVLTVNGADAFACGISVLVSSDSWVTKWDVSEPTNIEPAKGGWSGAMKRAGAQWGIGRYLYHLDEHFAEVSDKDPGTRGWHYARLPQNQGGEGYFWKEPDLPGWALPREPEHDVSESELNAMKKLWASTFAPDEKNQAALRKGFAQFVHSVCGEFPVSDHRCWTLDAFQRCTQRMQATEDPELPDADVPFEE